jgi:hypothetical protein
MKRKRKVFVFAICYAFDIEIKYHQHINQFEIISK